MQESICTINEEVYEYLNVWTDFTGWKLEDFIKLIKLFKFKLPIKILCYEKESDKIRCKDATDECFTMEFGYNYQNNNSTICIKSSDCEQTLYEIPNKTRFYNNIERVFNISLIRKNNLTTTIYKNTITKIVTINGYKYEIKIKIGYRNKELFKKILTNSKNFDKYLLTMEPGYYTMYIMPVLISKLELSNEDLEKLDLVVKLYHICDKGDYTSKVRLSKNAITEVRFFTDQGIIDISDKFIFTSFDKNFSFSIDDLDKFTGKEYSAILDFDINFAKKLIESIRLKKWLDINDIEV